MSGYVIAKCYREPLAEHLWPVLDLPDGPVGPDGSQHIHLHRLPDGGWTAVAMEPSDGHWIVRSEPPLLWRDVPTEPEEAGT